MEYLLKTIFFISDFSVFKTIKNFYLCMQIED